MCDFIFLNEDCVEIDQSCTEYFKNLLKQRKWIERYFNIKGFDSKSQLYVYQRIKQLFSSSEFSIKYNYDEPYEGHEWTKLHPTDAQIIMWMLILFFECNQIKYILCKELDQRR